MAGDRLGRPGRSILASGGGDGRRRGTAAESPSERRRQAEAWNCFAARLRTSEGSTARRVATGEDEEGVAAGGVGTRGRAG